MSKSTDVMPKTAKASFAAIKKIEEHAAKGEGDRWFYDCHFDNGKMVRVFNPNRVDFLNCSKQQNDEKD